MTALCLAPGPTISGDPRTEGGVFSRINRSLDPHRPHPWPAGSSAGRFRGRGYRRATPPLSSGGSRSLGSVLSSTSLPAVRPVGYHRPDNGGRDGFSIAFSWRMCALCSKKRSDLTLGLHLLDGPLYEGLPAPFAEAVQPLALVERLRAAVTAVNPEISHSPSRFLLAMG